MSEELEIAIDNLSKSLKEFEKVVNEMLDSKMYNKEYNKKLNQSVIEIRKIKAELIKLQD